MRKLLLSFLKHLRLFGVKGVWRRALLMADPSISEIRISIPDRTEEAIIRLGTTDVAAFEHVFLNREYDIPFATPPPVIVDAGANVGMSSVYFATRYPKARIIAIEPDPGNFSVLRKNAELFSNIVAINAALWRKDGIVSMHDVGGGCWGMQVRDPERGDESGVRSMSVHTLLAEQNITQVDLLKMDVEGSEQEILQEAESWIGRVVVICAELHDRLRPGCSRSFEIATAGFPIKWRQGELVCAAREGAVFDPTAARSARPRHDGHLAP
jgi:FkbM family methyltransferase